MAETQDPPHGDAGRARRRGTVCPKCRYEIGSVGQPRCPECGVEIAWRAEVARWVAYSPLFVVVLLTAMVLAHVALLLVSLRFLIEFNAADRNKMLFVQQSAAINQYSALSGGTPGQTTPNQPRLAPPPVVGWFDPGWSGLGDVVGSDPPVVLVPVLVLTVLIAAVCTVFFFLRRGASDRMTRWAQAAVLVAAGVSILHCAAWAFLAISIR